MTDRQKWEKFLRSFDIPFELERQHGSPGLEITVKDSRDNGTVQGYDGFAATVVFDESGKFERLRLWE